MTKQVDTQKYTEFVDAVTSNESKSSESFSVRLRELYAEGLPVERLLTSAVGMSAESVVFTCCPPAPDALNVSILKSFSSISISILSSISG